MLYTKVEFTIQPINEFVRDILTAELAQFEYDSFEETEQGIKAYIPSKYFKADDIESLQIYNSDEYSINYELEEIPDQNWNETWEKHFFNPIIIEDKCVIHSPFHKDVPQAEYHILIEPKMAFGTGHHETTGLMVKHILNIDFKGKSVLDMGCGTGILGILCAKRHAQKVLGIDIEEWAYNNANENVKTNNINNMKVLWGDTSLLTNEKFDIILANINRNILLEDISKYMKVLNDGGTLILSGFYKKDLEVIDKECNSYNLKKKTVLDDNNWVAVSYMLSN